MFFDVFFLNTYITGGIAYLFMSLTQRSMFSLLSDTNNSRTNLSML